METRQAGEGREVEGSPYSPSPAGKSSRCRVQLFKCQSAFVPAKICPRTFQVHVVVSLPQMETRRA